MINKIVPTVAEAIEKIKDGDTIFVTGFYGTNIPFELLQGILKKGVKDLTFVGASQNLVRHLILNNRIKKVIVTLPKARIGQNVHQSTVHSVNLYKEGNLEVEIVPQATLIERIKAAASGLGAFYTTTGVGTELAEGKETKIINGVEHVLEYPIHADIAICRANIADRWGNLHFTGYRHTTHEMISAAKWSIIQADKIVDLGEIKSNEVHTHGVFVDCVVQSREPHKQTVGTQVRGVRDQEEDKLGYAIGERLANDIPNGSIVELGFGLPWYTLNFLQRGKETLVHSEGIIGVDRELDAHEPDELWRSADGRVLKMLPGGSAMTFTDSFNLVMQGKVDYCLLGTFQVDVTGSFAGWKTNTLDRMPAVGASMELAERSKNVWIVTKHLDKNGQSKIMKSCTYPLTAAGVVKRIYTDFATLEVTPAGLKVLGIHNGMSHEQLEAVTGVPLLK
jgi:3-oxoacid CoA-transferase